MKSKIRNVLLWTASTCIKFLWLFPINKNQILFISFGGQYSDSPKYIYEYLHNNNKNYRYIWCLNNFNRIPIDNCMIISHKGIKLLYYMATSRVIITNDFIYTYYPKRKGQNIINTWHGGSPLKTVGMVGKRTSDEEIDFFKRHDKIYSCFLSSSKFMTDEVFRKSFGYTGKIFDTGMPRNAILLRKHRDQEIKVREYYGISKDTGIVLYAPTFRGSARNASFLSQDKQFNIKLCLEVLEKKFSKKFCFMFRAHHTCGSDIDLPNVYMASDYPDMQELLCASDILITDYSSCMGDEALMKKPVFLYCPDLEEYKSDRGFYWDIFSLPFPVYENEKSFFNGIQCFDYEKYCQKIEEYFVKLGSYENSNSDLKVGEIVIELMEGENNI